MNIQLIDTIIDLFCENGFLSAISHWRWSLWCDEKSISSKTSTI